MTHSSVLALLQTVLCMLLAILVPQIELVLAYKGALLGSFVIYILPGKHVV